MGVAVVWKGRVGVLKEAGKLENRVESDDKRRRMKEKERRLEGGFWKARKTGLAKVA